MGTLRARTRISTAASQLSMHNHGSTLHYGAAYRKPQMTRGVLGFAQQGNALSTCPHCRFTIFCSHLYMRHG
jgi:hypothetical protein